MAYADDLRSIRNNLAAELKAETAQRVADQAAGKGVKTTYTAGSRTLDWNGYVQTLSANIKALNEMLAAEDVYELPMQGFTR